MFEVTAKIQVDQDVTLRVAMLEVRLDSGAGRVEFAPDSVEAPESKDFIPGESLQLTPEVASAILGHPDVQAMILALKQKANPGLKISADVPKSVTDAASARVAEMVAAEGAEEVKA